MEIADLWKNFIDEGVSGVLFKIANVIFSLILGMVALRLAGKKSISQMTLPTVMFVFVLTSVLGSYLTKPQESLMSGLITIVIILAMYVLEKASVYSNKMEKILIGEAVVLIKDGKILEDVIRKNKLSIDQMETQIRLKGVPSIEACKTVAIEPNGQMSVEVKDEYEPVKKYEFDNAVNQILKAINNKEIEKAEAPKIKNIFDELKEDTQNIQTDKKSLE